MCCGSGAVVWQTAVMSTCLSTRAVPLQSPPSELLHGDGACLQAPSRAHACSQPAMQRPAHPVDCQAHFKMHLPAVGWLLQGGLGAAQGSRPTPQGASCGSESQHAYKPCCSAVCPPAAGSQGPAEAAARCTRQARLRRSGVAMAAECPAAARGHAQCEAVALQQLH